MRDENTAFFPCILTFKKTMFSFPVQVPLKSSNQAGSDLKDAPHHQITEYVQKFCINIV
jgi:hypothetical protein